MKKVYFRADTWLISKIQDAYLWLLDRTGIYVATLAFSIYAVICTLEIMDGGTAWIWGAILIFVGLGVVPRYLMQDKGQNERFNALSMALAEWHWRHQLNITIALLGVSSAITLHPWNGLADIGFVLYGYLSLVMIRDRDKKPFFKPVEKQEMALQHGSD